MFHRQDIEKIEKYNPPRSNFFTFQKNKENLKIKHDKTIFQFSKNQTVIFFAMLHIFLQHQKQ